MIVLQTKDQYAPPRCEVLEVDTEGVMAMSPDDLGIGKY